MSHLFLIYSTRLGFDVYLFRTLGVLSFSVRKDDCCIRTKYLKRNRLVAILFSAKKKTDNLSQAKPFSKSHYFAVTEGPTWIRHSSHIVFTSIIRLGGVDGFCFKTKLRIFVFINTPTAAKLFVMATALRVSKSHYFAVGMLNAVLRNHLEALVYCSQLVLQG